MLDMNGIILAGGENRRMGSDKAFLAINERPIIERIISVLKGLFDRVIVVTNSPALYASYDVSTVTDAVDARGPLTGIYTGLLRSSDEYGFVAACDMPFLNSRLIAYMKEAAEGYDAVVPRLNGQVEPLHAVYHRGLLPLIESQLRRDDQRIQGLFGQARVRYIEEHEIDAFDPEKLSFRNLNTPQQYKEALCSDWGRRS
jgi:molybdopterin-guanine dinucleotide biosynthesis protein A